MADLGEDASEALEWFTDPMVNVFSVFCFIVILLGFMSSAQRQAAPAEAAGADGAVIAGQRLEIGRLENEIRARRDPARAQKLQQVEALQIEAQRRRALEELAVSREDEALRELLSAQAPGRPLAELVPAMRRDIERLELAITDARARSELQLSAPRQHDVAGAETALMVIRGGRLYNVLAIPDSWGLPFEQSLRTFDPAYVDVQRSSLEPVAAPADANVPARATQHVTLLEGKGIDVRVPNWTESTAWQACVATLRTRTRSVVYLQVTRDSHAEFLAVRAALVRAGIDYNVEPISEPIRVEWVVGTPIAQ